MSSSRASSVRGRPVYYLPGDLIARVDHYAKNLAVGDPLGRPVTRTDAIRLLLLKALKAEGIE